MATSGGQPGNQNAAKKQWQAAINRALEKRASSRIEALDALAEKLLMLAEQGDLGALRELGDRIEGRPKQQVEMSGDAENPLQAKVVVEFVGQNP